MCVYVCVYWFVCLGFVVAVVVGGGGDGAGVLFCF